MDSQTDTSTASSPPPVADDGEDDMESMKRFVEGYLQARGFEVTARNARVVVATLATAVGTADWAALEQHVDGRVDRERLRPAA